jgi:hypothetical protein
MIANSIDCEAVVGCATRKDVHDASEEGARLSQLNGESLDYADARQSKVVGVSP